MFCKCREGTMGVACCRAEEAQGFTTGSRGVGEDTSSEHSGISTLAGAWTLSISL